MKTRSWKLLTLAFLFFGVAVSIVVWSDSSRESKRVNVRDEGEQLRVMALSTEAQVRDRSRSVQELEQTSPSLSGFDKLAIAKVTSSNPIPTGTLDLSTLAGILSYEKSGTARERVKALEELSLNPGEEETAYEFLMSDRIPLGLSKSSYHWLVDELMTVLRQHDEFHQTLSSTLGELALAQERDPVVRDYSLQHLGHLHEQGGGDFSQIESVLWSATELKEATLAGTALLALGQAYQDGRIHQDPGPAALKVANDPEQTQTSRVSALGIAARTASEELFSLAQEIIEDPSSPTMLKIASIAAIAQNPDHKELLQRLRYSPDKRVRFAAVSNLKKISSAQ